MLTLPTLAYGSHSLTAAYSGDANDLASISAPLSETSSYPALSITTLILPGGNVGQPYGPYSFTVTGGSGNFTWSSLGLPSGLSLSSSGVLSGTPGAAFSGSTTVTVNDNVTHLNATQSYSLSIVITALSVSGPATLGDVLTGGAISGAFTATGGSGRYTWTISGAAGLNIDANGNVTGALSTPGFYTVTATATDSLGNSGSATSMLSVFGITTTSLPAASTSSNYSASLSVAGGISPYTFSASGLPAGITFAGGTFGGRPITAGTYSVIVQVTDSKGLSVSATYPLQVSGPGVLTVTSSSLPNGTVGQPYSQVLSATGGSAGYMWAQSGGVLPAGLSLSSSGTILGTPTAATPAPYSLGVQVTDSSGAKAVGTVSIDIVPAPLMITTAAFPPALANVPWPAQILTASGGVPPYTFSITGSLPAGITQSGAQISGTPTAVGTSNFTIVVTDSAPTPATASLATGITVGPTATDLVLSSVSASFALTPGTSAPPAPSTIAVSSSVVSQSLTFSYTASVPWITVSGTSGTPGSVSLAPNNAALALAAAATPYTGTVTLTCTSAACSGNTHSIAVSLTVTAAPPQLSVDSSLLSFVALSSNPQTSTSAFTLTNAGGGELAITNVTAADSWVSVGSFPAELAPGPGVQVTVSVNPAGLAPGYYRSSLTVVTSAGSLSLPVTLLISGASSMSLGPAGTQFSLPQGGALGDANGSFLVGVTSSSAVAYTAAVQPGANWLVLNQGAGSASSSSPGLVSFSLNPAIVSGLAAGAYYGTIRVTASGVVNSPQDFQVILNVAPASTPVMPDV